MLSREIHGKFWALVITYKRKYWMKQCPFLPAALPSGLRETCVVVVLVVLVLVKHHFQITPKRCPIFMKLSGIDLGDHSELFY